MKYMIRILYIYVAIIFSIVNVYAAVGTGTNVFSVKQTPENPTPGENITFTLSSYGIDLDTSDIVWLVNNKISKQSIGLKSFTIVTPNYGDKNIIEISVTTLDKKNYKKIIEISPQDIDLLWEAPDSYVPPFYKGKAFPAEQGIVRFVAIPNFFSDKKLLDRDKTVYYWKRGENVIQSTSGFGKNSYVLVLNYLTEGDQVTVSARSSDYNIGTTKSIYVTPKSPEIMIYEANPLLGTIYSKAFKNGIELTTNETTFIAEPFGFSGKNNLDNAVRFSWTLNDQIIDTKYPNRITVRKPNDSTGLSLLKIKVKSIDKILQEESKQIPLKY